MPAAEIGEFLTLLTLAYDRARAIAPKERDLLIYSSLDTLKEHLKDTQVLLKAALQQHGPKLRCSKVSYGSPFEIWFTGTVSALALAVILAGGEFKGPGFTIKIKKSLGASLAELRKALFSDQLKRVRTIPPRRPTVIPKLTQRKKNTKIVIPAVDTLATRSKKEALPDA